MHIFCEYTFCIYQRDGKCLLENITVNGFGSCQECICVDMDREMLEKRKRELLCCLEKSDLHK